MMMNTQIPNQHSPLPEWKTDWLYALVFKELDSWCSCADPEYFYLIAEHDADNGSQCTGSIIRAWLRDQDGMKEISIDEHLALKKLRHDESRFRYECLAHFHIQPDRQHIVYG